MRLGVLRVCFLLFSLYFYILLLTSILVLTVVTTHIKPFTALLFRRYHEIYFCVTSCYALFT